MMDAAAAHKAASDGREGSGGEEFAWRWPGWRAAARVEVVVLGLLATMTLLLLVFGGAGSQPAFSSSPRSELVQKPGHAASRVHDHVARPDPPARYDQDRLIGGLLSPAFDDEQSCRSRYASSSLYRHPSPFRPSTHLVEHLRRYEARHSRCGPGAPLFKEAVDHLRSGRNAAGSECQYVVWTPINGLGNRMLSLASTFLYALLTDRVLLVHASQEFEGLF